MLVGLAEVVGLAWRVGRWPGDGRIVQANDAVDLSHEIAHFVMASPSARRWRFYGLGSPSSLAPARAYFTAGFCRHQENLASLLGIAILAACGAPTLLLRWNLADHSWTDSTGPQIQGIACSLSDRGLVWFRSATSRVPIAHLPPAELEGCCA